MDEASAGETLERREWLKPDREIRLGLKPGSIGGAAAAPNCPCRPVQHAEAWGVYGRVAGPQAHSPAGGHVNPLAATETPAIKLGSSPAKYSDLGHSRVTTTLLPHVAVAIYDQFIRDAQ